MLEKIFLCHHSGDAQEVELLAEELRLRGVVPWVDKEGGFSVGDENVGEAERAITEDCFGLLFYATEEAFKSEFIRRVEMKQAIRRKDTDPDFLLFALPCGIGFDELSKLSTSTFGIDLSRFATRKVSLSMGETQGKNSGSLSSQLAVAAQGVLDKVLAQDFGRSGDSTLQLQFSSRERLANEPRDTLCVDVVRLLEQDLSRACREAVWARVHTGLLDVKRSISARVGRVRLRIHGSKHLTAAFTLGHVFSSVTNDLEIRTKGGYWSTDCAFDNREPMIVRRASGNVTSKALYLEISTGGKEVSSAVRRRIRKTGSKPFKHLRMLPGDALASRASLDNFDACAIANQVRRELEREVSDNDISEVHMFAAITQALATFIGCNLNAMPPIQLYEFDGRDYYQSYRLR